MEIILRLLDNRIRPVTQYKQIDALIDTGAVVSVFNSSAEVFEILFDVKDKARSSITGFGGKCEGFRYVVKELTLGETLFQNVPFFVPDERHSEEPIIFACTMFEGYAYEIDMKNHVMTLRSV